MEKPGIRYLLLYRTRERWRFTVGEESGGMACGGYDDMPGDVPFETAEARLRAMIAESYGYREQPVWREIEPGWWRADLDDPARKSTT